MFAADGWWRRQGENFEDAVTDGGTTTCTTSRLARAGICLNNGIGIGFCS